MKHVKKSVLLWYAPHEIYQLVTGVERYPEFLPWCERVEVLSRDEQGPTARLHLAYSGIRHAFTTRNVQVADESVHISLVDGPFSLLDGLWRFLALPLPSAAAASTRLPARSSSRCATPSRTPCSRRRSARCSTASPTRSSTPSCGAPSRSMAADEKAAAAAKAVRVTIAFSPSVGRAFEIALELAPPATALAAIRASGVFERHPELALGEPSIGIWGRACVPEAVLADGDRVEIYRPLTMDPNEARRLRARKLRAAARR